MPAYLGTGKTPDAALWNSAPSPAEISDEVLFDLRQIVGLLGRRYRIVRRLATSLDEVNVTFSPKEIPQLLREVDELLKGGAAARPDIASSFEDEIRGFQNMLWSASETGFYVVAHLEHHVDWSDIKEEKKRRASRKASEP